MIEEIKVDTNKCKELSSIWFEELIFAKCPLSPT
jgi:hypothetical protein